MSSIDLDKQVLCRSSTLLCCGCEMIVLSQYNPHLVCYTFDVCRIIHPPGVTIPRLQVLLGFSIARQRALFAWYGGEVRMDVRPKERGDGGRTVPTTIRMTAVIFLDANGRIA